MFWNSPLDLIGIPLLALSVFAYLAYLSALILAIVGIMRSLAASDDSSSEDQPYPGPHPSRTLAVNRHEQSARDAIDSGSGS